MANQALLFADALPVQKSATISDCGLYRYDLTRTWQEGPLVTFLLFNPSIADSERNDPTVVRCMGFARSWGYGGTIIVNLYAYRATDPRELWKATDPVGPENDTTILTHAAVGRLVIAAWGAKPKAARRVAEVCAMLDRAGRTLHAIRETKGGHPEHPLFLPGGLKPFVWKPKGSAP